MSGDGWAEGMPTWMRDRAMAVYEAEDATRFAIEEYEVDSLIDIDGPSLDPADVAAYAGKVMRAAGWVGPDPVVLFDVPDDDDHPGRVDLEGIHLHPKLCTHWTVVHEVAHWLDPRGGHDGRWAATMILLTRVAFGEAVSERLLEEYQAAGVPVDQRWLNLG